MRGMSLIEMLVGIVVSLIILGGLFQFTVLSTSMVVKARQRVRTSTNLQMARDELAAAIRYLEPEFWQRFPVSRPPFSHTEFFGAVSADPNGEFGDAGVVLWDLTPTIRDVCVYSITDSGYPDWVSITPVDDSNPMGPSPSVGNMSVLLFHTEEAIFPALVSEVVGDVVFLSGGDTSLWEMPAECGAHVTEVICLGTLRVTHCGLFPEPGRKNRIVYQPWFISEDSWLPGRRRSSYTQIDKMSFVPSDGTSLDQIVFESCLLPAEPGRELEEIYVVLEL